MSTPSSGTTTKATENQWLLSLIETPEGKIWFFFACVFSFLSLGKITFSSALPPVSGLLGATILPVLLLLDEI